MRSVFLTLPVLLLAAACQPTRLAPGGRGADDDLAKVALDWLDANDLLDGVDEVEVLSVDLDHLGMAHVRLQQLQGGVPVLGGQILVHLDEIGDVKSLTDRLLRGVTVDVAPSLDQRLAGDAALFGGLGRGRVSRSELQVLRHEGQDRLAWRVQLEDLEGDLPSRPVVYVDAHTGEELLRYDNLQTARNRNTHSANNGWSLPGTLRRNESSTATGDQPIDWAHDHAGFTYDYYWQEHGRDSWDGAGATIVSTAHYGSSYDNAFWDGTQMVYGDGGYYFTPLSGALDVVGHEITHAVTERTAGLIYSGESGGLNEATSDILGAVIESFSRGWVEDANTWMIGEEITQPALGDALRYMDNPPADGVSIDNYADYYSWIDVHYSSGIANKAFYLMVQDPSLDIRDAGAIWYRALAYYMTPSTTFAEAREATVDAATDLHGAGTTQVAAVKSAWTQVGVLGADPVEVCDDGLDNDTDGSTDCDDADCGGDPACQAAAEVCGDGFDNDGDGAADCDDSDCSADPTCDDDLLSGAAGEKIRFRYDTPPGASRLIFTISGGTGDADLYVRYGVRPTLRLYDCRPYLTGNEEQCVIDAPLEGTYHVMVRGFTEFSGVSYTVVPEFVDGEVCDDGVDNDSDGTTDCADPNCAGDAVCPLSAVAGDELRYSFETPAGATRMTFAISGGTGDADLYVSYGVEPTLYSYDCSPYLWGNEEICEFDPAQAGTYHVMVHAYEDFDGVYLTVLPE